MAQSEAFKEKIRQLGALVGELDAAHDGPQKTAARELVQLLMEVHGKAFERLLEIVFESGPAGETILAKAGDDAIVRQLLLLYSLHPLDLETRVARALDDARPRLRRLSSAAELVSIREGFVEVRLSKTGHACGSTAGTTRSIVEEAIYDLAPDLTSLEIIDPDEPAAAGFVSLDSLVSSTKHTLETQAAEVVGAD